MSRKKFLSIVLASLSALSCSAEARKGFRGKYTMSGMRDSSESSDFSMEASRNTYRVSGKSCANGRNGTGKFLNSATDLSYTGLSKSKEKEVMHKLKEMGVSKSNSESNINKIIGILVSIMGFSLVVATFLAFKYCGGSSLNWEDDKEKIIKFITWANGSCIENSYLNMFLNPIFLQEISKIPVNEWNREDLKNQKEHACGKEEEMLETKLDLIKGVDKIQEIWDNCGSHDYIGTEIQNGIWWRGFWSDFAKYSPESFGDSTSVNEDNENTKHPLLISGALSTLKQDV